MTRTLTSKMKKSLRDIVQCKEASATSSTLKALATRGLCDKNGKLTYEGWKQALVVLPLDEQCHLLGSAHEKLLGLDFGNCPEFEAWRHFCSLGYTGAYCEGGPILLLIRSAALDTLARINAFQSRRDACERFTEAQLAIHEEHSGLILDAIRTAGVKQVIRGFKEIYTSPMIQECYPGITVEAMASLFVLSGQSDWPTSRRRSWRRRTGTVPAGPISR